MHDLDRDRAEREAAYEAGVARYHELHPESAPHLTRAAIDNCQLCDQDGYRGAQVCDHVDHRAAAERGIAACRAALAAKEADL